MLQQIIDLSLIVEDNMERAEAACGVQIAGHIVLLCNGFHARTDPTIDSVRTNPLLTAEATRWLYDRSSRMDGVEGLSADKPIDDMFGVLGVPLKVKGGSGSPVRAFAIVQAEGGIDRV